VYLCKDHSHHVHYVVRSHDRGTDQVDLLLMIIVNGQTKTLIVFGDVSQNDFQMFMAFMAHAIAQFHGGTSA